MTMDYRLLYVIAFSERGPCKIGYAANPHKRLVTMQTGNPLELKIYSLWEAGNVQHLERSLHNTLRPLRIRGEWFKTTPAEIAAILAGIPEARHRTATVISMEAIEQAHRFHPRALRV